MLCPPSSTSRAARSNGFRAVALSGARCGLLEPSSPRAAEQPQRRASSRFQDGRVRPKPSVAPVTTIAWRMAHLTVSVLGTRVAAQFGGPAVSVENFAYAGSAAEAFGQLDDVYGRWVTGVARLGNAGLGRPSGPSEVQYGNPADLPLVSLVLHISREVIHHGAEIAVLRDLYSRGAPRAR